MTNTNSVTKEILGLEKKYWMAMQEHDLKTALELTDFPCIVASSHGIMSIDQKKFEEMFNTKNQETIRTFHLDQKNAEVRMATPETAVVAYQLQSKLTNQGEDRYLKAIDTSTWIKRDGKWVCAMHTEVERSEQ